MADIVKKSETPMEWDPFRAMRDLFGWDPFREMAPIVGRIEREWNPTFEVREQKDAYVFTADVPGVKKDDLEVTLTGNRLTIAGKRFAEEEHKDDRFYTYERSYGSFSRVFTLPEGIDVEHVKSELADGVLTLAIPKIPAAQPKKIAIGAAAPKS
jgi:HSP20 family protein